MVHLIFVCKPRGKVFNQERLVVLEQILDKVCNDFEAELVDFNGEEDHAHLVLSYPPKHSISANVNSLKGVSSRRLKEQSPEIESFWSVAKSKNSLWSPSYFSSSVGGAPIEVLKRYIQEQKDIA